MAEQTYCKNKKKKISGKECFACFTMSPKSGELKHNPCHESNLVSGEKLADLHKRYKGNENFRVLVDHLNTMILRNDLTVDDFDEALLLIKLDYLK